MGIFHTNRAMGHLQKREVSWTAISQKTAMIMTVAHAVQVHVPIQNILVAQ